MQKRNKIIIAILTALMALGVGAQTQEIIEKSQNTPVKIIFDTDIAWDWDDAGATAMLHGLANSGEVEILGMAVSAGGPSKIWGPQCLDVINTYYNRPDIPIGVASNGDPTDARYAEQIVNEGFPQDLGPDGAWDAVELYRKILSEQPDAGVVFLSIGYLNNLSKLLDSKADEYSPLNGRDLVSQKVIHWVCMGGEFPEGHESNFYHDNRATKNAVDNWPTPILFCGLEVGHFQTGTALLKTPESNPVRRIYEIMQEKEGHSSIAHSSYDQAALLAAVRDPRQYWDVSPNGTTEIKLGSWEAWNTWSPLPHSGHRYIIKNNDNSEVSAVIDNLMAQPPASETQHESVTITPVEYAGGVRNPVKSFKEWKTQTSNKWSTVGGHYVGWNELENDASDGIDKIIDWTNEKLKGVEKKNFKIIPRVYLDYPGREPAWPDDMKEGDYTSEQFVTRVKAFINKLGLCWDNDPRIAYVQMGIIGKWGEHHSPAPNKEMQDILANAFMDAFQNKKITRRYPWEFKDYNFGIYWDSFAHAQEIVTHEPAMLALGDYWKTAIIEGETAYNWGDHATQPGDNPTDTMVDPVHRNYLIDVIKELHCTNLGWVTQYDRANAEARAGAEGVQVAMGYRFVITEFSYPDSIKTGDTFNVSFSVVNTGSAPFYYEWPVELSLLDENKNVVWKQNFDDVDIRTWYPGDDYDKATRAYTKQPEVNTISGSFYMNEYLAAGKYTLALSVLDPAGSMPSLRFAINNYFNGGRHPMGYIGINAAIDEYEINPADFDDMYKDNSLSYSADFDMAPTYTLSTSVQGKGTVSPEQGLYYEGRTVTITATPDPGYKLDSWSGDFTGSENPIRIIMDADKSITATFTPISSTTFKLSTTVVGSGYVKPDSGSFYEGTIVRLQAIALFGYRFKGWGGDLSGTTNPVDLLMDGDKNITATFEETNFDSRLVAFWNFDEGNGRVVKDHTDYGHDGRTRGYPEWVPGVNGTALHFNDVSKFMDMPVSTDFSPQEFTIALWAKWPDGLADDYHALLEYNRGTWDDRWYGIMTEGHSLLFVRPDHNGISGTAAAYITIKKDQWYHIAATLDSNGMGRLYFDGKEVANNPKAGPNKTSKAKLRIGANLDGGETANAIIDQALFYEAVLTETEIGEIITGVTDKAKTESSIPTEYGLTNYPNPFNPLTTIEISIPEKGVVSLKVFNILGKEVAMLVHKELAAGVYKFNFDAKELTTGIYFYSLTSKNFVQTKKMTLLK